MESIEEFISEIEFIYENLEDLEYLTAGGQKRVFKFISDNEYYVLKCVPLFSDSTDDENFREEIKQNILARAYREIEIMNNIDSPHLIKLGNITPEIKFICGNEYLIYSEEMVDGQDLQQIIRSRALTVNEVIRLGIQISLVISLLWENKYIHRDIKPNNIMLNRDGDFILLDAGVAFDLSSTSLTYGGPQPGTKIYMSPEQYILNGRQIDFRSDLYSLGLVMYEGLCQRHAFIHRDMSYENLIRALSERNINDISTYVANIPSELERIIVNRLLADRAHKRFKSCSSLIKSLQIIESEMV